MTWLLAYFGPNVLSLSINMMLNGYLSHDQFAHAYPDVSSWAISAAIIMVAAIYLNIFLAAFNIIVRSFELGLLYLSERYPEYARHNNAFTLLLYVLIASVFISPQLRIFLIVTIARWGYFIAHFLSLL
jgi:hypothetical protein